MAFEVASTGAAPLYNSSNDHYPPWWFAVFGSCAAIARTLVDAGREVRPGEIPGEHWTDEMEAEWSAACGFVEASAERAAAQERLAAVLRQARGWWLLAPVTPLLARHPLPPSCLARGFVSW